MKTWTVRLGLSLMVAIGFWTSRAPAQHVAVLPSGEQVLVVPTTPYEPLHHYPRLMTVAPPIPPGQPSHALQGAMNRHGVGCQSNWAWGSCGSVAYDFHFVFGSCRSFFGERCEPYLHPGHMENRWTR